MVPKRTAVTPERFWPVISTTVPGSPSAGLKAEIEGVAGGDSWALDRLTGSSSNSEKKALLARGQNDLIFNATFHCLARSICWAFRAG